MEIQLIQNIDAIARQKQRAVLYVEFHPQTDDFEDQFSYEYEYENDTERQTFLDWLQQHGIAWQCCAHVASECGFESYLGQIYIDLAMDDNDPLYCQLRDHLEFPDGTWRDPNKRFYYLPLDIAMRNAHHDEPGFWENLDDI